MGMTAVECCYVPKRYIMVFLTCIGMMIAHAMRVNVAVTVVTILDKAPATKVGTIEAIATLPDVTWNSFEVGFLHASFYLGYIVTQIPGGYLAQKVPSHRLFGGCILVSCLLNCLIPVCVSKLGYAATCIVRILQGLSEGLLFPSTYAIMRHWTTPQERSRMGAIVLTGVYTGPVIGLPLAGCLTHFLGWTVIYYVTGGAGAVWFLFWLFATYEKPSEHPFISPDERKYIEDAQGETAIIYEHDRVPWSAIFTSLPVFALNICNFARSFIFFLLLTNEPLYLNVFNYSIAENGILSALPHIMMASMAAMSGPIADYLISDPYLTATDVRKLFTSIGFGMEATCCLLLGFIQDGTTALVFLSLGVGISGFTISGWQINHLDIAPRYASVVVGLTTAVGTVAGIVMPLIIGVMTPDQTIEEWHRVFMLTASILAFAVIIYLLFGTAVKQPWAEPSPPEVRLIQKGNTLNYKPYTTVPTQQSDNDAKMAIEAALINASTGDNEPESVRHRKPASDVDSANQKTLEDTTGVAQGNASDVLPKINTENVQPTPK